MTDTAVQIHLNFPALSVEFFRRLQHYLDIIRLLEAAVENVSDAQVAEARQFMLFSPARGAELHHEEARQRARAWLQTGLLRDSIEAAGLFLDECLSMCAVVRLASAGRVNGADLNNALNVLPQRHHKLHFPVKLEKLEREFNVTSPWASHALSLNRLRTCLVHRLGKVSGLDVDETNELVVVWRTTRLVARGKITGKEVLLDRTGILIDEESMVEMNFLDLRRSFKLGTVIELTSFELYSTIITLWSLGLSCAEGVEAYARSLGIKSSNKKMNI